MTLEAQNRAIAEVCGWRAVSVYEWKDGRQLPKQYHWDGFKATGLPNYTGSLDAMLSAFPVLTTPQWDAFLFSVLGNASGSKWASFDQIIYLMKQPPDKLAQHFLRAVGRWQEKGEK